MSNVLALTSRFGYVHGEKEFFSRLLARIAKYPYVAGRKQEVSLKSAPSEHVSK
jgi:hypothetical protein